MNDKIQFYYNPMSRGRIVHWMLEEVEAPYEIKLLDWKKAEHKSPEYLKINPMGKIPTIVHRGTVVTESAAICAYLADAFPNARLAPAIDDPARGTYYRWLFFAVGCVEPAMTDLKFPRVTTPEASRLAYGNYESTVNTLQRAVSNGYILGDRFSAADVFIASQIGWGFITKELEQRPDFVSYLKRCTDRPAYERFVKQAGAIG